MEKNVLSAFVSRTIGHVLRQKGICSLVAEYAMSRFPTSCVPVNELTEYPVPQIDEKNGYVYQVQSDVLRRFRFDKIISDQTLSFSSEHVHGTDTYIQVRCFAVMTDGSIVAIMRFIQDAYLLRHLAVNLQVISSRHMEKRSTFRTILQGKGNKQVLCLYDHPHRHVGIMQVHEMVGFGLEMHDFQDTDKKIISSEFPRHTLICAARSTNTAQYVIMTLVACVGDWSKRFLWLHDQHGYVMSTIALGSHLDHATSICPFGRWIIWTGAGSKKSTVTDRLDVNNQALVRELDVKARHIICYGPADDGQLVALGSCDEPKLFVHSRGPENLSNRFVIWPLDTDPIVCEEVD